MYSKLHSHLLYKQHTTKDLHCQCVGLKLPQNNVGLVTASLIARATFLAVKLIFIPQCTAVENKFGMPPTGSRAPIIHLYRLNCMVIFRLIN